MTRYRLVGPGREVDARGLTLEEAFARMMAWAGQDYIFTRVDGVMLLQIIRTRSFSDFALLDPKREQDRRDLRAMCPLFESEEIDDRGARRDLMLQAIANNLHGYRVAEDELQRNSST